ncbi:MAG: RNA polymerase sigma factor [Planctomycetota bacterium]
MYDGPADDDPFVLRAADGDEGALQTLLEDVGREVQAGLRVNPRWSRAIAVEDVLQVTFMEAFLRIRTLRDRSRPAFTAWLTRIAENNLNDAIRALERDKRPDAHGRVTSGPEGESSRTLLARLAAEEPSIGTRLGEAESVDALMDAISRLPDSYRRVVRALDLEERPVSEVAGLLDRSVGAVHMLHSRALDRLRDLLIRGGAA